MLIENEVVNGLWIGNQLSPLELLTLHSFTNGGHKFNLWIYDELKSKVPAGVLLRNANEIIEEKFVFRYPKLSAKEQVLKRYFNVNPKGKIDWGAGSFGGFSDLFRYKLLQKYGGWWVDMDVTCLRPFNLPEPYFFRNHWKLKVVGNIMKVPPDSTLMKNCYEKAKTTVNRDNKNWHKPIEILNEEIEQLGLMKYRRLGLFNLDLAHVVQHYHNHDLPIPNDWYGIHWINSSGAKKIKKGTTFSKLLNQFDVPH